MREHCGTAEAAILPDCPFHNARASVVLTTADSSGQLVCALSVNHGRCHMAHIDQRHFVATVVGLFSAALRLMILTGIVSVVRHCKDLVEMLVTD